MFRYCSLLNLYLKPLLFCLLGQFFASLLRFFLFIKFVNNLYTLELKKGVLHVHWSTLTKVRLMQWSDTIRLWWWNANKHLPYIITCNRIHSFLFQIGISQASCHRYSSFLVNIFPDSQWAYRTAKIILNKKKT